MKVILLGTGQKIFEDKSMVRQRMIEYGKIFDELHLIVFSNKNSNFCMQKLSENVYIYPSNTKIRILYFLDYFIIARQIIDKIGKEDIVLSTQDPFETGLVGLLLKLFYKLPLQIQVHTDFANKYFIFESLLNSIRFLISHITLSFADSVRVVSERIAKNIHISPEYLSVLPIYTEAKSLEPGVDNKSQRGEINFLTVARLEKEKDLKTALQAFKKVLDSGIKAIFTIVGDGSERGNLDILDKSLEIEDKVIFTGWQNNLENYYKNSDIYISTSLYEGYGMSMVEAARHSLPLIISDAGVANEVFVNNKSALIIKPKDTQGLIDAMFKLTKDVMLRRSLGREANIAAISCSLSKEQYLERYRGAFEQAVIHSKKDLGIFKRNILARYLVAGFIAAFTNIGLLYIFTDILKIWYLRSSALSFIISIWISFMLQKVWTFSDKKVKGVHHQFFRYMAVAILGIIINTALMFILVDLLKIWYLLAQIMVGAIIAGLNFLMYKFFIFRKK